MSLFELEAGQYGRVRPLVESLEFHLSLIALLSGASPGAVYADDQSAPRAVMARTGHRFFLAGTPQNAGFNQALARLFHETLIPQARAAGLSAFSVCHDPAGWEPHIDAILPGMDIVRALHECYHLSEEQPNPGRLLPDGFTLQAADRSLLEDEAIARLDLLREEMCSERPTVDAFLENSFGVCAVHDDDLAGWCLSEYNTGRRCEIGIATLDPYRRQGVATALASAFVETARARGIAEIGWHCYARNVPSGATARAAGLKLVRTYPAHLVWLQKKSSV
jgi:GNAT superfamily N-acetyltransferase